MLNHSGDVDLHAIAREVMRTRGFDPQFPQEVQQQLKLIIANPTQAVPSVAIRDLRYLLWSSIDNDDSRDLDQIEYAQRLSPRQTKVLIGIADVDAFVRKNSPIDMRAADQTTSVYTGIEMFPMLPLELSTGLTSLHEGSDRLCIVVEFVVAADGNIESSDIYGALLRNKAQLTYSGVGGWLQGKPAPDKLAASAELQEQLKLQDEVAQDLKGQRYRHGALNIETAEVHAVMSAGDIVGIRDQEKNRASELIEEFMIAANGTVARMFQAKKVSSIRRVVRTPERWDRIVQLAAQQGGHLPPQPDAKALNDFLMQRKATDPDHFADLSLAVVKLLGPGEYVLERPGDSETGHFALSVQDYTHSTAPNRRFPDLVSQRLLKAVLAEAPPPYSDDELAEVARNCTVKQDAARKVERDMSKRIAAVALRNNIGQIFDAIVTGVNQHGTFVRTLKPRVDGMLIHGKDGLDVGDKLRAKLVHTDVYRGYIDLVRA
jgi:exoribonuclease-2